MDKAQSDVRVAWVTHGDGYSLPRSLWHARTILNVSYSLKDTLNHLAKASQIVWNISRAYKTLLDV